MRTVNEVSQLTGISIRTLQYYDQIGLLNPTAYTDSGYRLYDDNALERLQTILFFRELNFSLKEIQTIINSSTFNQEKALAQQITLLTLKKEHLEDLIAFAREIQTIGVRKMDFNVFNTKKIEEYTKMAKTTWGHTEAYQEFEQKSKGRSKEKEKQLGLQMMHLFTEFGQMKTLSPDDATVQQQVKVLQDFISKYFYHCSNDILRQLGMMYASGNEFTQNIDKAGGEGTATFVNQAIQIYCQKATL